MVLTGCMDLAAQDSINISKATLCKKGEVYTMRGGLGGVFSKGMNHLQSTLEYKYKIRTGSTVWYKADKLSETIIKQYETKELQAPIILVGHSLGANGQINVAKALYRWHIPVALLVTVEAVLPAIIPPNVKKVLNLHQSSLVYVPLFNGLMVKAEDPTLTYVENVDVSKIKNISVNHFTIDKNQAVQDIMLRDIMAVFGNSSKCE